jgi:hypothetical protein
LKKVEGKIKNTLVAAKYFFAFNSFAEAFLNNSFTYLP